jgi:CHAD domain-containing protein
MAGFGSAGQIAMKPVPLHRRWRRRRERLLAGLHQLLEDCRQAGTVAQVHLLRVTLRRLGVLVRLGAPLFTAGVRAGFRTWARRVADATSAVRDMDVALEWLAQSPTTGEAAGSLLAKRAKRIRAARSALKPLPAAVLAGIVGVRGGGRDAERLARRFAKLESRYEEHVRCRIGRFFRLDPEARHEFRRTLRWWRYLREIELPRRRQTSDRLLKRLLAVQEAIGDQQNRVVTRNALTTVPALPNAVALRRALDREEMALQKEIAAALAALARERDWPRPARKPRKRSRPASSAPA